MIPEGPIVVGAMLNLICDAAVEFPLVSFTWTGPDGQNLFRTQSGSNGSILSITFLGREEFGNYTCTASNKYGSSQLDLEAKYLGRIWLLYFVVTVMEKPSPDPLQIEVTGQIRVVQNSTVTLFCEVSSKKPYFYHWTFNGVTIASETSAILEVPSFSEDNVGVYRCVVTSKGAGGQGSTTVTIGSEATLL